VARAAGARSRLAAASSGALIFALLPVLGSTLALVPLPALAGLVILAGIDLVDLRALRRAAATRGDAGVLVVTLIATLWLDVVQAVYAGLFLALVLLARRGGRLQMLEIVRAGPHRLREIALDKDTGTTPAVVLHLEGDLNFAVASALAENLLEIAGRGAQVLILRLKRARHLDATVLEALRRVAVELRATDQTLILCGLTDPLAALLARSELAATLGEEGLLRAGPRLMEGYERAVQRARERLRPLDDAQIFRSEEAAGWSYEI
jgi:SulP family sulfate permease